MASASAGVEKRVVLASADASLRQRLNLSLTGLRWDVLEANGGAEAFAHLEAYPSEALVLDHWLPDLEVTEFATQLSTLYPDLDLLRVDGGPTAGSARSPRRHELLHALREAVGASHRGIVDAESHVVRDAMRAASLSAPLETSRKTDLSAGKTIDHRQEEVSGSDRAFFAASPHVAIDGMIGATPEMLDLARLIRLVAPRSTTVLVEGETGSGKEVVAQALHRLSSRSSKPFIILNCAAIPDALLEAELFGHTRGAFTGAIQARTGRIEAAHGGTLFLDEIGEMPLHLQAKVLRFFESGELQRVGDNEVIQVDVRVVAATNRQLESATNAGTFRLDLYHRLAVFPIEIPPLRERLQDLAALSEHFLTQLGKREPRKVLSAIALAKLKEHDWPGNVRELAHVLERACILAEGAPIIGAQDIRVRHRVRSKELASL
jgi:transcriptional regulator with GAF, ATPase, and Fis domain